MPGPEDDLKLLRDGVAEASEIAMTFFGNDPDAHDKGDGQGPVSEADLAVDTCLKRHFIEARPDYGWLSEETDDDPARFGQEHVFIVDPIDGTRSFLNVHENWAISAGIARDGVMTAAVVGMPAKGLIYEAALGTGARMNGDPIGVTPRDEVKGARILANGAMMKAELWPGGPPPVERHFRSSLAYRMCLVAQGRFDGMFTLRPTWEWDVAAGDLICREAGVNVSDMAGAQPRYNSQKAMQNGMIAAAPGVHRGLMTYLT